MNHRVRGRTVRGMFCILRQTYPAGGATPFRDGPNLASRATSIFRPPPAAPGESVGWFLANHGTHPTTAETQRHEYLLFFTRNNFQKVLAFNAPPVVVYGLGNEKVTILPTEWYPGPDRLIPINGRNVGSWYKMGLLNALIHYMPRKCLEIGTRFGGTAKVFTHYFTHYKPQGVLVTCDIASFCDLRRDNVVHQLVYPHSVPEATADRFHAPALMLPDWQDGAANSVERNTELLRQFGPFDFVYVDGDHSYDGVSKDWQIVGNLTQGSTPVVFDDVVGQHTDVTRFYTELCITHEHTEFGEWPMCVGLGLTLTNGAKDLC